MPMFHVLVWKSDLRPGEKTEPVAKYMVEAANTAQAIERGTEMFFKDHPDKRLDDHHVNASPA